MKAIGFEVLTGKHQVNCRKRDEHRVTEDTEEKLLQCPLPAIEELAAHFEQCANLFRANDFQEQLYVSQVR